MPMVHFQQTMSHDMQGKNQTIRKQALKVSKVMVLYFCPSLRRGWLGMPGNKLTKELVNKGLNNSKLGVTLASRVRMLALGLGACPSFGGVLGDGEEDPPVKGMGNKQWFGSQEKKVLIM